MALLRSQTLPKLTGRDTCNGEVKFVNSGGTNQATAQNPSKLRNILNKSTVSGTKTFWIGSNTKGLFTWRWGTPGR